MFILPESHEFLFTCQTLNVKALSGLGEEEDEEEEEAKEEEKKTKANAQKFEMSSEIVDEYSVESPFALSTTVKWRKQIFKS